MKGLLIAYMLIACALGFVQEIRTLEDLPVSSNTFSIDVADLESHAVEHTDIYGTPVIVFEPSPSNPILSVLGNGKIIWKNPGDECVGITSTYVTLPRLVSFRIKTIDLVLTSHFYTYIDAEWVDIDEETFISLVQQTGMHPQIMIDILNINTTVCNASVVPMDDINVANVSQKGRFEMTEILEDGMTIWSGRATRKAIHFSFAPLTYPLFLSIVSECYDGKATMEYYAKVGRFWEPVNESEYTCGLKSLGHKLIAINGILDIEDAFRNVSIGALGYITLSYKSHEKLEKIVDGKSLIWDNRLEECTSVFLHCRRNGMMFLQVNVVTRDGRSSTNFYYTGISGWILVDREYFYIAMEARDIAYTSLDICGIFSPPEDLIKIINIHPLYYPNLIYNAQPDVRITSVFCGNTPIWLQRDDEYSVSVSVVDDGKLMLVEMFVKNDDGVIRTFYLEEGRTWLQVSESTFLTKLALVKRSGFMRRHIPSVDGFQLPSLMIILLVFTYILV